MPNTFTYIQGGLDTVSRIRFAIADTLNTEVSPCVFWDEELLGAFGRAEAAANVDLAGALALESLAADRARIAVVSKQGPNTTDARTLAMEYREMARCLRDRAVVAPVVLSPDAIFTLSQDGGLTPGTMDVW